MFSSSLFLIVSLLCLFACVVRCDVYLHYPAGSNDRLRDNNEQADRNRDNGNRLFDSQNNNRGGYEAPTVNNGRLYFYEGSILPIEWTAQHSCSNPTAKCDFILQYMCDGAGFIRDGSNAVVPGGTARIPKNKAQCTNQDCDSDMRYGRHESYTYWKMCDATVLNMGLFHADQQVAQNNARRGSALHTRQDNNANRNGYECNEERDYYPYWRPTPWKDIAILTNTPERCPALQAESQNVKSKMVCVYPNGLIPGSVQDKLANANYAWIPITEQDCVSTVSKTNYFVSSDNNPINNIAGLASAVNTPGIWTAVPSWGIAVPECLDINSFTRDNSLGNTIGGFPYMYNWTIPSDYSESCVLRIRYNITTGDFNFNLNNGQAGGDYFGYASATSAKAGQLTAAYDAVRNNADGQRPSRVPVWLRYGLTVGDIINPDLASSNVADRNNPQPAPKFTRGYVWENDPIVDIFGYLLKNATNSQITTLGAVAQVPANNQADNDNNNPSWYTAVIGLRLAMNTDQYSRTFQDRTYTFAIRQRPPALMNRVIHNVGVRGKRGNIVQTYPSVEHDFIPNRVVMTQGDLIHFQWALSDYNRGNNNANNDNAGEGTAGTSHNNVVIMRNRVFDDGQSAAILASTVGQWGANYPGRIDDPVAYPFLCLSYTDLHALAFNGLNYSYFDLGPRQVTCPGTYHYMSTRNNNFSNRSQKGKITVLPSATPVDPVIWSTSNSFSAISSPNPSAATTWTGGAYLDYAPIIWQNPGTAVTQQEVWLMAYDNSGFDSPWIQVNPPDIQVTDAAVALLNGDAPLCLKIPHSYMPLFDVVVWYKANQTVTGLVQVNGVSDDGYTASVPIGGGYMNQGGFYTVQHRINNAAIAGVVIGTVAFIAIVSFLYWKVRIQPSGGFQAWIREKKALLDKKNVDSSSTEMGQHEGLVSVNTSA